jgi:hypothetical protein
MKQIYTPGKPLEQAPAQQKKVISRQAVEVLRLDSFVNTNKKSAINVLKKWVTNQK